MREGTTDERTTQRVESLAPSGLNRTSVALTLLAIGLLFLLALLNGR